MFGKNQTSVLGSNKFIKKIPTLNLLDFDDDDKKKEFVKDVYEAYTEWGFCAFIGHGINNDLINKARESFETFFNLPIDAKMRCHWPAVGGRRGYTPFGVEKAKNSQVIDLKEFFHIGRENVKHNEEMPHNVWPHELPRFKDDALNLYNEFEKVGMKVLSAMSLALGGDGKDLCEMTVGGNSVLRALHYPPIGDDRPYGAIRAAAHEDISFITLLIGASAAGLEVRSRKGEWVALNPESDAIVVNVGDMLQKACNRIFPSTTHRVVNPEGMDARKPRYSLPFFMDPHPDTILKSLPYTVTEDRPELDPRNIRSQDYLMERMREIGLEK